MASRVKVDCIDDWFGMTLSRRLTLHQGIQSRPAGLATLHAATDALHGTFDRGEVLKTIRTIAATLSGSDAVAVFEIDRDHRRLRLVSSHGVEADGLDSIPLGAGLIGAAAEQCAFYECSFEPDAALVSERYLRLCLPLMIDELTIGAIAIFGREPDQFEPVDRELFRVFGKHAASALYLTGLFERAKSVLNANW